jgi:hypothetical protein
MTHRCRAKDAERVPIWVDLCQPATMTQHFDRVLVYSDAKAALRTVLKRSSGYKYDQKIS